MYAVDMTSHSVTILSASVGRVSKQGEKRNLQIGTAVALCKRAIVSRMPLLALALLAGGTTMAAAAVEPRFLCEAVRPGDTAVRVATRLMQRERSWREPKFQIFDPIGARFIPKAHVQQDSPGWQACVVESSPVSAEQSSPVSVAGASRSSTPASGTPTTALRSASVKLLLRYTWLSLTLVCFGAASTLLILDESWRRRMTLSRTLEGFGQAFVREFERPLVADRRGRAAVLARLNVYPRRGAVDVLVAPVADRRYPNLADHRINVEYDVHRVLTTLDDRRLLAGHWRRAAHGSRFH